MYFIVPIQGNFYNCNSCKGFWIHSFSKYKYLQIFQVRSWNINSDSEIGRKTNHIYLRQKNFMANMKIDKTQIRPWSLFRVYTLCHVLLHTLFVFSLHAFLMLHHNESIFTSFINVFINIYIFSRKITFRLLYKRDCSKWLLDTIHAYNLSWKYPIIYRLIPVFKLSLSVVEVRGQGRNSVPC